MPSLRPMFAAAALVAAPGPWLLESSLRSEVEQRFSRCAGAGESCGSLDALSLDAGGLHLHGVRVQRRGFDVAAEHVEVRPAWDGVDVHVDGLAVARVDTPAETAPPTSGESPSANPTTLDTHGLTVRVMVAGTTAITEAGVTALLDTPTLTIGPDGVPKASVGVTLQHARGSVHSQGPLRATPRSSLKDWAVSGTLSIADGPPLRMRGRVTPSVVHAELEHEGGGWMHLAAWPKAKRATVEAQRFALHGLGRLGQQEHGALRVDARDASLTGHLQLEPADAQGISAHVESLALQGLTVEHPKLSAEPLSFETLGVSGDVTWHGPEQFDAALALSHQSLALSANVSRRPGRAGLRLEFPTGPCQRLFDAIPTGFAEAMRGTQVKGDLAGHLELSVDFAAAQTRADILASDPLAEPAAPGTLDVAFPFREQCTVVSDPSALDLAALRGPYRHRFEDAHGTPRSILVADGAPHTVTLEEIPVLAGAFVTLEDSRYFRHDGLDLEQVANAVWHNLAQGEVTRGASTITQQAARNLFLGLDRTAARKLQEAFLATRIDADVGKRRLLEIYLNIIELAPGVHGVEDASQFYFGKSAADLTPLQATHLAMMAPAPRTYSQRFVSGQIDEAWRPLLHAQVRRLARHHVIDRPRMIAALRGDLELLDRR